MTKTNKRDEKLKLVPLLTESIYLFDTFSEHYGYCWIKKLLFVSRD